LKIRIWWKGLEVSPVTLNTTITQGRLQQPRSFQCQQNILTAYKQSKSLSKLCSNKTPPKLHEQVWMSEIQTQVFDFWLLLTVDQGFNMCLLGLNLKVGWSDCLPLQPWVYWELLNNEVGRWFQLYFVTGDVINFHLIEILKLENND